MKRKGSVDDEEGDVDERIVVVKGKYDVYISLCGPQGFREPVLLIHA